MNRTSPFSSTLSVRLQVLGLALCAAVGNFLLWAWVNTSIEAPGVESRVLGLSYTPFQRHQDPSRGLFPQASEIESDLALIARQSSRIRTYSTAQFPSLVAASQLQGLELTAGVWLTQHQENNEKEILAAVAAASEPHVKRLIVGNETVLKNVLTPAQLSATLQRVRTLTRAQVSTAEPWNIWLANPSLADSVDFITIHLLPYWEGIDVHNAVGHAMYQYDAVRERFPGKRVLIGEVGWPSNGETLGAARATPANQAKFIREFLHVAKSRQLDYFLMEANDQPWKVLEEGKAGGYWGLSDAYRVPKFAFHGPIENDPYWPVKATVSSLLGLAFLLGILGRLRGLRWGAKLFFVVAAQACLSLAVYLCVQPFAGYMRISDWLGLAILVPTLAAMVLILLAHAFEFAELFWEGSLQRLFLPKPLPATQTPPFVSIHVACSNEPPDMVIATLTSLSRLRYSNFEVIVVDNNTRNEADWQPVRQFMQTLPENFRFFHLPKCEGFKAGALNFALKQTSNAASIVGVVDADYVVNADWLHQVVAYFDDPAVGIVQAPQAHREWSGHVFSTMMNWEYDGFFRIGMHHRNERNAIIQHGTMTLIRADALREHGAWQEACVCEDAELGLRLMRAGYSTVYVDQVAGCGLTPDSFEAFRRQRFRWAQGGMQILKMHRAALFGVGPRTKGLSDGQRYHFLAGWLPWFGDALHFLFAVMAIAWTVGTVLFPSVVSLPTTLFMMPLVAFVTVKLVIGPLLYWRRVPCSFKEILGASVAGMGLSHAIARGVFAGLFGGRANFVVTLKGGKEAVKKAAGTPWHVVREEVLMLAGLLSAALLTGLWVYFSTVTPLLDRRFESFLWMLMLVLQALPYAAALVCVVLSERPVRRPALTGTLDMS